MYLSYNYHLQVIAKVVQDSLNKNVDGMNKQNHEDFDVLPGMGGLASDLDQADYSDVSIVSCFKKGSGNAVTYDLKLTAMQSGTVIKLFHLYESMTTILRHPFISLTETRLSRESPS